MDYKLLFSAISLFITIIGWAFTYGKLTEKVETVNKVLEEVKNKIVEIKEGCPVKHKAIADQFMSREVLLVSFKSIDEKLEMLLIGNRQK